jgi:hypothetical protein
MSCSCAYLDVVLSYEMRLPFLQDLEEYFHEMIQECWVLWRLDYHLQVMTNDMQCDVKLSLINKQKEGTQIKNEYPYSFHVTACWNVMPSTSGRLGLKILVARRQRGPTHNYKAII